MLNCPTSLGWKIGGLGWALLAATLLPGHGGTVVLDGSYGTSGVLTGPAFNINSAYGRQVGSNLFQSFGTFNLSQGESATFSGPAGIQNILARVTGGNPSTIDGSINSSIAGANLFLLNSAGVIFGPHSAINVTGSFLVGTPDYIKLADGGRFNTALGGSDNLTSAPVSAFGFLSPHPAPVEMFGAFLTAHQGQGLHVIAGDVTLDDTELDAPGGSLTIFSAASAGEVPFSLSSPGTGFARATNTAFGNVAITDFSYVDVDGAGGGHMVIRGGKLTVDNATVSSFNTGTTHGGDISLQANHLLVQNEGEITSNAASSGSGGNISVRANSADILGVRHGQFVTGLQTSAFGTGNGGAIDVSVTGAVTMGGGAVVSTDASASGSAGDVMVHAGSLSLTDAANILSFSQPATHVLNTGAAGAVTVAVDHALSIASGGLIGCTTLSAGTTGAVTVQAGSLVISGANAGSFFTGISNQTDAGATGNASAVDVTILDALTLTAGGGISSNTFSAGSAGNVNVQAGSVLIDGSGTSSLTSISSNSDTGATGDGGAVSVNVNGGMTVTGGGEISVNTFSSGSAGILAVNVGGTLSILSGGEIAGGTFSSGNSGQVSVHATALTIDGAGNTAVQTGISDQSGDGATGNAGSLAVTVDDALIISAGGEISSGTRSSGNAGSVTVRAGSLTIEHANLAPHLTGITSETDGARNSQGHPTGVGGNAGSVDVTVDGALQILGGKIDTDTFCSGSAGNVAVQAGSLTIDDSSYPGTIAGIFSDSNGFVGDISGLGGDAGSVLVSVSGAINLATRGQIGAATLTNGNGGNVDVDAGTLNITGSAAGIAANAIGRGNGGNVTVTAGAITISDFGVITASSLLSNAGSVVVNASDLNLESRGIISTSARVNGGNITLDIGGILYLDDGGIFAVAQDNGGDILIQKPGFVVLNQGVISANAALGQGGNIEIDSANYFASDSLITATGSRDGTVIISAPDLDLSGSLIALPAALVNQEKRLREKCERAVNHEFSTFIVVGRGGTESGPDELQADNGADFALPN